MQEIVIGMHQPEYVYRQEDEVISCFIVEDVVNNDPLTGEEPLFTLDFDDEEHAYLLMDHLAKASL